MDASYRLQKNPGATAHTYSAGGVVGGVMQFDLSIFKGVKGGFVLEQVVLADPYKQASNADLVLMSAAPAAQTDNTAFAPATADLPNIIAVVPLTNHHSFSANGVSRANQLAIPLKLDPTQATLTLFAVLVTRATPTYNTTSGDLTVSLSVRTPDSLADGAAN